MVLAAVVVAVAVGAAAIGHQRLAYWWSWAPAVTFSVFILDFVLCLTVAEGAAFVGVHGGWHPTGSDFLNGLLPAAAGSVVTRRPGRELDAFVLGLVAFGHAVAAAAVSRRVEDEVRGLSDAQLLLECARLDAAATGAASASRLPNYWRRRLATDLTKDGQCRREARAMFENALIQSITETMRQRARHPRWPAPEAVRG